jgi:hypothetical protein
MAQFSFLSLDTYHQRTDSIAYLADHPSPQVGSHIFSFHNGTRRRYTPVYPTPYTRPLGIRARPVVCSACSLGSPDDVIHANVMSNDEYTRLVPITRTVLWSTFDISSSSSFTRRVLVDTSAFNRSDARLIINVQERSSV